MSDQPRLVALGNYRFTLGANSYQSLYRSISYRWNSIKTLQQRPGYQNSGTNEETIILAGAVFNYQPNQNPLESPVTATGTDQIEQLRRQAALSVPLRLALDDGRNLGYWMVTSIRERQSEFIGSSPLKQAYNIKLEYFGERI